MIEISDKLTDKLEQLPELPGIYKMLDSRGDIIYIGKSKSLKKRVRSYFTRNHEWSKIKKLVLLIHDIETVITDTHLEARLLECQLIKEIKPAFNAQMKNDKEYVYLKVEQEAVSKALSIAAERSEDTYGLFRSEYKLQEFIDSLLYIFPIMKKNGGYVFEYHIFPSEMNQESFTENKNNLIEVFTDRKCMDKLIHTLVSKMEEAATANKFETAAKFRDIVKGLDYIGRVIWRYIDIMSGDILLKIPTGQKHKLFFVSNGAIVLKKLYDNPSSKDIDLFIKNGRSLKPSIAIDRDEKAAIDYHDILYSEVSSLPKDMVQFLCK